MLRRLLAGAAFACGLALAAPALADPSCTSLPLTATNTTFEECTYSNGSNFWTAHLNFGWDYTNGAPKAWSMYGGIGAVTDANNAAFQGAVAMTVGTTYTAQRSIAAICTVAGNMSVTFPDGSTLIVPVQVGFQTFPFAVTAVNTSGTTATCSYSNLK